ncbi:MAG: BamA/TamA family outer membrane protein, partial [Chitinophagales bacterium]|nr:BamA/TamA family outer membrane protein [Chitinophagales bacterium]
LYYFKPAAKKNPVDSVLYHTNPSQLKSVGVYTLEKQFQFEAGGDIYTQSNLYFLSFNLSYYRFPNSFFGIGNNTLEENGERYTNTHPFIRINVQREVAGHFYAGVKTFFEHTSITGIDSGGILDLAYIPGEEGGFNTGLGPWFSFDTRNNIYYPTKGIYIDGASVFHTAWLGSEYEYIDNTIEISYFLNTWEKQVLAFNGYAKFLPGDPPFNRMAELGGPFYMRGNYEGLYRDKYYTSFQTEYRIPFLRYFGLNIFGGIGDVAPSPDEFVWNELKYSWGGGLRINILPGESFNLRLDYGFGSNGDHGFYFQFNEAF